MIIRGLFVTALVTVCFIAISQEALNYVDTNGMKQGFWKEFRAFPIYETELILEVPKDSSYRYFEKGDLDGKFFVSTLKGKYKDNLKTGVWKEYYPDGNIKREITYKNGIPNGICKSYYYNGTVNISCTIDNQDSIQVKAFDVDGSLLLQKKVSKSLFIRNVYMNY